MQSITIRGGRITKLLTYLQWLTDDFGVWQHTKGSDIDRDRGYALDDSARALIVFLMYGDRHNACVCLDYIALSQEPGGFTLYFDNERQKVAGSYSEDAHALAVWATAVAVENDFRKPEAQALYAHAQPQRLLKTTTYLRTVAYLLIAFCAVRDRASARQAVLRLQAAFDPRLGWFEDRLTYANAILPFALLRYRRVFGASKKLDSIIQKSIDTLEYYNYIGRIPAPIGNRMWQKIGEHARDIYGQQAIDAAFMVLMYSEAAQEFSSSNYRTRAKEWLDWFTGNNIFKASLLDERFACADGLDDPAREDGGGISPNRGAESTIVYLLACYAYDHSKIKTHEHPKK